MVDFRLLEKTLDRFDFQKVAQYMMDTNWKIEDLEDGRGGDNHRRFIPDEHWLRRYVVRSTRFHLNECDALGWEGLGFSVVFIEKGDKQYLRIQFTDIRHILVES